MELIKAIFTRQSISKVSQDPIPRELIVKILDAAATAPNHHRIRPWRFVVLTGNARLRLGDLMAQTLIQRNADATPEQIEIERKKPLRAPVLIAVGVDKPTQPKSIDIENICACAAAVQNLLLAAHDCGLGAFWRTGSAVEDAGIKTFLGFEMDQHVIAIVYLGYPENEPANPERPLSADRTRWIEE
jgi:nitroreductase